MLFDDKLFQEKYIYNVMCLIWTMFSKMIMYDLCSIVQLIKLPRMAIIWWWPQLASSISCSSNQLKCNPLLVSTVRVHQKIQNIPQTTGWVQRSFIRSIYKIYLIWSRIYLFSFHRCATLYCRSGWSGRYF